MPIDFTQECTDALVKVIRDEFKTEEKIVLVEQVKSGSANDRFHFKAVCESGSTYGMKLAARFNAGQEREKVMADMAELLSAPNVQKSANVLGSDCIDVHKGQAVVITPWLSGATTFNASGHTIVQHDATENFFFQAGQWIAFSTLFGITDRHGGHWVWVGSGDARKLLMIDLEDCFSISATPITDQGQIKACLATDPAMRHKQVEAFKKGFMQLLDTYKTKKENVDKLLAGRSFPILQCGITDHDQALADFVKDWS